MPNINLIDYKDYLKIGIIGSRTRDDYNDLLLVDDAFNNIKTPKSIIISGGHLDRWGDYVKGADRFAKILSDKYHIPLYEFIPVWNYKGNTPYYIRDCRIARVSDYLIACWDGKSKGTKITIDKYKYYGKDKLLIV